MRVEPDCPLAPFAEKWAVDAINQATAHFSAI
jgi:hypothetical protein